MALSISDTTLHQAPRTGWVVTGGHAGHQEPCIGVVEALGITPEVKLVDPAIPWRWLAPYGPAAPSRAIRPPWPDLVLVSGRQAIPYGRAIKRQSGGRTFVAVLQNPVAAVDAFDLVWVNEHDVLSGKNVIRTPTTPHRMTDARLAEGAAALRQRAPVLSDPVLGVVVGGGSRFYRFGADEARALARDVAVFAAENGYSIALTPSRRTGADNIAILKAELADAPAWVWDMEGENPYFGILGAADRLIVTCDSVNMLGEAAFTGRPVHAYKLPGSSEKISGFHKTLIELGPMRWFDGSCEDWGYDRLDATGVVASEIRRLYTAALGRRVNRAGDENR